MQLSPTEFNVDVRDLKFVIFEQLKADGLCAHPRYAAFSREELEMTLDAAVQFAREVVSTTAQEGDRTGCRFESGRVAVPPPFKAVFEQYRQNGWVGLSGNPEYGGMGLPMTLAIATGELFTGANCAFSLYNLLITGAAHVLEKFASDDLKQRFLPNMYSGRWGATMVLTEPVAGSDVGNSKSTAVRQGDHYLIRGSKIFITGGDQDLTENIVHLVLARVKGAPAGTRGLSLFLVPKFRVNPDGSLGEANDVVCTGIEHKMGIKGSATCSLTFGDNDDCRGFIIGNEGDGLRIMFHMMNEARLDCGVQGESQAFAAYLNALAYASTRLQGSAFDQMKNADAPRVPIIEHPDVRRMLLRMKAQVEGMRSILLTTAWYVDRQRTAADEAELEKWRGYEELITPICKAYCSDLGFEMCSLAVQTFGGYGYCGEYPVERYLRDTRIASIYEGANGIQALDLVGRKLGLHKGRVLMGYCEELRAMAAQADGIGALKPAVEATGKAVDRLLECALAFAASGGSGDPLHPMLFATPYLRLFGHAACSAHLLWQAGIAARRLAELGLPVGESLDPAARARITETEEGTFLWGKLTGAVFFAATVLPEVDAIAASILSHDSMPMLAAWKVDA